MSSNECTTNNKTTIFSEPFADNEDLMNWVARMRRDNYWLVSFHDRDFEMVMQNMDHKNECDEQRVSEIALERMIKRLPGTIFKEENKVMANTYKVDRTNVKLPGTHLKFDWIAYYGKYFPIALALAQNPKNTDKYSTSLVSEVMQDCYSYPYDDNRMKIPANKNGSDYVCASPLTVVDKFIFIIDQIEVNHGECEPVCADLWSMIFHNDIRCVIVVEDLDEDGSKYGRICPVGKEKKIFTREIAAGNGAVEEEFEVQETEAEPWDKEISNSEFTIKQGNTTKTVTFISVGKFGKRPVDEESSEELHASEIINEALDKTDCFKEMAGVLDIISSKSEPGEIPRVMIRSRGHWLLIEVFIAVYYLWQLAKKDPSLVFEKELWEHLTDLRLQRWNFFPQDQCLADLVFLCQSLFLEGKECVKDLGIYDVLQNELREY